MVLIRINYTLQDLSHSFTHTRWRKSVVFVPSTAVLIPDTAAESIYRIKPICTAGKILYLFHMAY